MSPDWFVDAGKIYKALRITSYVLCIAISIYWGTLQTFEEDVELEHFSIPKCIPLNLPVLNVPENTTSEASIHLAFMTKRVEIS